MTGPQLPLPTEPAIELVDATLRSYLDFRMNAEWLAERSDSYGPFGLPGGFMATTGRIASAAARLGVRVVWLDDDRQSWRLEVIEP